MLVIVPNYVSDEINRKLDKAIAECPDAEKDRAHLYSQLLSVFHETGQVPDFSLVKYAHEQSDPESGRRA